jgi:hypothetical protein
LPIRGNNFSLSPRERAGVRVSVKLFSSRSFQSFKALNSERGFMGRAGVRCGFSPAIPHSKFRLPHWTGS